MGENEIEIDESTSRVMAAITKAAGEDALALAKIADIDPEEFRLFLVEYGETENEDGLELLQAAESLRSMPRGISAEAGFRKRESVTHQRESSFSVLGSRVKYLLLGGGIGAFLALLFAPKSGLQFRGEIADATRKGIDRSREAAELLGERAAEYYDAGRERASELYSTSSEMVGDASQNARDTASDLARSARETASRQTGTVAAAIDAGKKAYQEEKRKSEHSGRREAAPNYDEKAN
jgi:gas vesicle protein